MTGLKTTAVGYVRVSTSEQQLSPEAQREVLVRWAAANDIQLLGVYHDVCSGATPWAERPGLSEAVAVLKRKKASWLVTAKADRLSRDLFNMLHLQRELESFDAAPISCTESPEDTTSPEKELMRQMLASFAQFERQMIRGRIKAALKVRQDQGVKLGALPLEDTELGRCIIWAVWFFRDRGYGAERIVSELNERNITGPRGGKQHVRNVQRILQRERPTQMPKQWEGINRTWKKFDVKQRRTKSTIGNRTDPNKTGGLTPGEGPTVGDCAPSDRQT